MVARTRSFDTEVVLATAAGLFARLGYEATSVDDLVRELGVHRGSLYGAFGSKRGLFVAVLDHLSAHPGLSTDISQDVAKDVAKDTVLVALLELAPHDPQVRDRLTTLVPALFGTDPRSIGDRLLTRAEIGPQPGVCP